MLSVNNKSKKKIRENVVPALEEKSSYNVAILGATGVVGRAMIDTLERRNFPVEELRLLASSKSAGIELMFKEKKIRVEDASTTDFKGIDIALFSAGASASRVYSKKAVDDGAIVIDNSSAFRLDEDVPLIVPEVNPENIWKTKGIISNPNCSTIQFVVALKPLLPLGIERVFVSTYQSVSGMGKKGIDQLLNETKSFENQSINKKSPTKKSENKADPIAFNVLPKCDYFLPNGYTREEMKILLESRKILNSPDLRISATAVRVPVLYGHSESVAVTFKNKVSADDVRSILKDAEGVVLLDDPSNDVYPHPNVAEGSGETFVGRIRQDLNDERTVLMFVVADNILKGAAWNAVQIAEKLILGTGKKACLTEAKEGLA